MENELFQISHEIKNSLSVVKGYMCLFDGSIEKYDKYMPSLSKALNHSIELLNDFNDIGKLNVKLDILDINYLLEEVVDLYSPVINSKKINFICDINERKYISRYLKLNENLNDLSLTTLFRMILCQKKILKAIVS